jgi:O-antigen ligase
LPPLFFSVAHLLYGVDQALSAQWFVAFVALLAAVMAATTRPGAFAWRSLAGPLVLFGVVIVLVALSVLGIGPHEAARQARFPLLPPTGAIDVSTALLELSKLGGLACAFVLGLIGGADRRTAKVTVNLVLGVGAAYAAISLLLYFAGAQSYPGERLSGGFLSSNSAALVFGMLLVIAVGQTLSAVGRRSRQAIAILLIQLALFGGALCLTASRMGMFATFVATVVLASWDAVARRRIDAAFLTLMALTSAGLLVLLSGNGLLRQRVLSLQEDASIRRDILEAHWSAFLNAPLGGYGLGSFTTVNNLVMTPENYGSLEPVRAMHNVYLQWLEEGGLLTATPMFALVCWLLVVAARHGTSRSRSAPLQRGLIAASLVVLLLGLTDFGLQTPSIAAFWAFILGVGFALGEVRKRKESFASSGKRNISA